jgi:hypothetical protein
MRRLKFRICFLQLKPILVIFLRGFSLSGCPQNGLRWIMLRAYVVISYAVIGLPSVTEI